MAASPKPFALAHSTQKGALAPVASLPEPTEILPTKVLTLSGLGGTLSRAGMGPVTFLSQVCGRAGPEQASDGGNHEEHTGEGRAREGTQCHPSSQACPFYRDPWGPVEGGHRPPGPMPKLWVSFPGRRSLGAGAKGWGPLCLPTAPRACRGRLPRLLLGHGGANLW